MRSNLKGDKALVTAIILQAISDAMSKNKDNDPDGAVRFINARNKLFIHYCSLLKINPEYAAKRIQKALIKDKLGIAKNLKR
ncbi:MAG: hypothetical protein Q8936_14105 [Bacillota bacterium]|nr:hypothetical protein [Bacillota bacterium]